MKILIIRKFEEFIPDGNGFKGENVRCIYFNDSVLWIGMTSDGLYYVDIRKDKSIHRFSDTLINSLTIFTIFSYATVTQNDEVDVYLNNNKIAAHQPLTLQQKRELRREEIINNAIARREQILLANQRAVSETHLQ